MNLNRWLWPIVLTLSSLLISLLGFSDSPSPFRPWIALWFVIICPGMALQRLMGLRLSVSGWSLAIAFSLAVDTTVGVVLLYTGNWSWQLGLGILVAITMVSVILDVLINRPKEPQLAVSFTSVPARTRKPRVKANTK